MFGYRSLVYAMAVAALIMTTPQTHAQFPISGAGGSFIYFPRYGGYPYSPYFAGPTTLAGYGGDFQSGIGRSQLYSRGIVANAGGFSLQSYSGPIYFPGWWADQTSSPRMRTNLNPAVRVPQYSSKSVRLAGYSQSPTAGTFLAADPHARVEVSLPCQNAQVWLQGFSTTQTGSVRHFVTPELQSGCHYAYTVKASWQTPSGNVVQTQTVHVRRGCCAKVSFCR